MEWLTTNLHKRDRFFFLGLNNAIPIKELGHCSAYVLESVELTQGEGLVNWRPVWSLAVVYGLWSDYLSLL